MKSLKALAAFGTTLVLSSGGAWSLEIDPSVVPEINLGGRAVVTGNFASQDFEAGGSDERSKLDISDSSLVVGFGKYLFTDVDYGFGVIGITVPDDDSDLEDDVFLHQLQVGIGGRNTELMLGRSQLPTSTLIQFPTVRDDDLLDFTHVGNGFSNREAEEDAIFGGQIRGALYVPDANLFALAAVTARTETDVSDLTSTGKKTGSDLNGLSLALAYDVPQEIKFDRGLRYAGIGLDLQRLDELSGSGTEEMAALLAGVSYNLSDNPERAWALDLQTIYNFGVSVPSLDEIVTRARAESVAVVGALRYASRPYLQSRWQAALTVGFKDYRDFDDASAFTVTPSFTYRVGSGVDLLAQYRFLDNGGGLAAGTGLDGSHTVFLGLAFAFDATFNESVGRRGSIIDLEHDMLNPGPTVGGH
jgi:hypothetical protein